MKTSTSTNGKKGVRATGLHSKGQFYLPTEKSRNESRIRYLKNMIAIAKAVKVKKDADAVCLFDTVRCFIEEDDENIPISSFNQKLSKNINNMP